MSLLASLPAPSRDLSSSDAPLIAPSIARPLGRSVKEIPPYGQRQGFIPRKQEDYGDGKFH